MKYRTGELDQRVTIRRTSATTDEYGGQELAENVLAEVWAKVVPRTGNERFFSDQVEARADVIFVIRNRSDVELRETDIINWDGDDYNLTYVAKAGERKMYLELSATRGAAIT